MMILALDMASTSGWAAGTGADDPQIGHVTLPPVVDGDRGNTFSAFRNFLLNMLAEHRPEVVIFESPILPVPFVKRGRIVWPTNIKTTSVLQGLAAIVELECHDRGIFCCQVEPSQAKKELTGDGRAEKAVMKSTAERVLGRKLAVHDEADAFACWIIGVRLYAKEYQMMWDKRVWGSGRGGLL